MSLQHALKSILSGLLLSILLIFISCDSGKREGPPRVLVFSKTAGFVHNSIPDGIAAIQKLGSENNFLVDTTTNAELFTEENLAPYGAVVFLNTTMNVLDHYQEAAFERYIQSGGGFVGVHSATDTEYSWKWYGKMVGAYFMSHPATQEATFMIEDKSHPATAFFEDEKWTRTDELYNFKEMNPDVNVILSVDESSYEGGANGDNHPMAWYHEYDGGRAFYTALGHTKESYQEEKFLRHLLAGIQYAIGDNMKLDYTKAKTQIPPDGNRFSKKVLAARDFFEPTEMAILPNKDVLVAQRRGQLHLYKHATKELKQIATLDVYHQSGVERVNAEEGFMGLQKDPNFVENNWIYTFYAPAGEEWVNRLSRFKFVGDSLDMASEQVILDVESQRKICCHTGGSIAFDKDGLLYLSTGDNSTPFNEPDAKFVNDGYAPLNDLPGKQQYDARRSSGNTNDLRGKILRIKVNEDGSYDIPEGNLFPKGAPKTRPEIYTMGHRNPYRISIDQKNGYVYWGDVGPDAREDNFDERGSMGYDEVGQARGPGNFGWPLFVGYNQPYREYNYKTGESGELFDAKAPLNKSKNNTGLEKLPPAQPAFIAYSYDANPRMPEVASGGRNAMAGPVYYNDLYEGGENELPEYYDGKVIIYDWIRGWMRAVTLWPNGDLKKIEPFAPDIKLSNLIDMEVTDDGTIYLLEYGSGWFTQNDDAALSFIEYNGGNRPPIIAEATASKTSGPIPLSINFSVDAMDQEKDAISYKWDFGDGNVKETKEPKASHTYQEAGDYRATVEVIDAQSASSTSNAMAIAAGNSMPVVDIEINGGNSSFFLAGLPVNYKVTVKDNEDKTINEDNVYVTVDYLEGFDEAAMGTGHQQVSMAALGQNLIETLDCQACHKIDEKSIGPSYVDVAKKYKGERGIIKYLSDKIIKGSVDVWGEVAMPAHPNLSKEDANQMAIFIQSLAEDKSKSSLPMAGTIKPEAGTAGKTMVITASYTDNGNDKAKPLTGVKKLALQSSSVSFGGDITLNGFTPIEFGGMDLLITPRDGGSFALSDIDLKGIKAANIVTGWQVPPKKSVEFEIRLDDPEGELIGKGKMPVPKPGTQGGLIPIKLNKKYDVKAKKLFFVYNPSDGDKLNEGEMIGLMNVTFEGD